MCGLRTAPTIRFVIGAGSILSLECTEATRTSSRPSISGVWSSDPSSRMSTSIPLSRVNDPPRCSLTASTTPELARQPLGAQPVGHPQPWAVVGEHEVVVAQLHGRHRHLLQRRAAVGPVGVGVQVAAQPGAQLLAARGQRAGGRLEPDQALGDDPVARVGDDRGGARADAGQLGERAVGGATAYLVLGQRQDRARGLAEGLDPAGLLALALHQERDPAQGGDRTAGSHRCRGDGRRPTSSPPQPRRRRYRWSPAQYDARAGRVAHRVRPHAAAPLLHDDRPRCTPSSTGLSTGVDTDPLTARAAGS